MTTKQKSVLSEKVLNYMKENGIKWNDEENNPFPVSMRTLHTICNIDCYNVSSKSLKMLCDFLDVPYFIDGSVLFLKNEFTNV